MSNNRFSPKVKEIISHSREEALRFGHDYIGTEHLLLGVLKEPASLAVRVLESLNIDSKQLVDAVEDSILKNTETTQTSYNIGNLPLTKQAEKVLKVTFLEAKLLKSEMIGTEHIMLSVLKHKDNLAARVLLQFDITYEVFKTELEFVGT
jgi:ATP-dependent Clp protease ATP-binding subunit ClpC